MRNLDFFIALLLPSLTKFQILGLLNLVNFLINLFNLLQPPPPLTTLLLSPPKADAIDYPVIFDIKLSDAAILLKF